MKVVQRLFGLFLLTPDKIKALKCKPSAQYTSLVSIQIVYSSGGQCACQLACSEVNKCLCMRTQKYVCNSQWVLHTVCTCVHIMPRVTSKLLSLCTVQCNSCSRKVSTLASSNTWEWGYIYSYCTVLPLHIKFWVGAARTYVIVTCTSGKHMCMNYWRTGGL